jgi:hypothetical protein
MTKEAPAVGGGEGAEAGGHKPSHNGNAGQRDNYKSNGSEISSNIDYVPPKAGMKKPTTS